MYNKLTHLILEEVLSATSTHSRIWPGAIGEKVWSLFILFTFLYKIIFKLFVHFEVVDVRATGLKKLIKVGLDFEVQQLNLAFCRLKVIKIFTS